MASAAINSVGASVGSGGGAVGGTSSSNINPADRNTEATVHVGQLEERVSDDLLWELMAQAGPVRHVYVPRDRITGRHHGYGFCEFRAERDAAYAAKVLNMVPLFGRPLRLQQSAAADRRPRDVGANLFVGNLADVVDEKLLHDAFAAFGPLVDPPYIMRGGADGGYADPAGGSSGGPSKGYGFVKYADFDAADAALATMNGQYIANRPIVVQYAFKKDGGGRERHGSVAERTLAAAARDAAAASDPTNLKKNNDAVLRPHTIFADRPRSAVSLPPAQQPHAQAGLVPEPPPPLIHYPHSQYNLYQQPQYQQQQNQQLQQQHHHQQQEFQQLSYQHEHHYNQYQQMQQRQYPYNVAPVTPGPAGAPTAAAHFYVHPAQGPSHTQAANSMYGAQAYPAHGPATYGRSELGPPTRHMRPPYTAAGSYNRNRNTQAIHHNSGNFAVPRPPYRPPPGQQLPYASADLPVRSPDTQPPPPPPPPQSYPDTPAPPSVSRPAHPP